MAHNNFSLNFRDWSLLPSFRKLIASQVIIVYDFCKIDQNALLNSFFSKKSNSPWELSTCECSTHNLWIFKWIGIHFESEQFLWIMFENNVHFVIVNRLYEHIEFRILSIYAFKCSTNRTDLASQPDIWFHNRLKHLTCNRNTKRKESRACLLIMRQ